MRMHSQWRWLCIGLLLAATAYLLQRSVAQEVARRLTLGKQPNGSVLVPSNQTVTPGGVLREIQGARPRDVALSPDGSTLAILTAGADKGVLCFDAKTGEPTGVVPFNADALGLAWAHNGKTLYASAQNGSVARFTHEGDAWKAGTPLIVTEEKSNPQALGLAVSPDDTRLYVALGMHNAVAVVSLPDGKLLHTIPVGVAPYRLLLSPDGATLYVANRGGQRAKPDEKQTEPSAGTPVRVDPVTDAARGGSLSVIDTTHLDLLPESRGDTGGKEGEADAAVRRVVTEVNVGRQPSALAITADGQTLYIANSDDDSVSVFDTRRRHMTQTLSLTPPQDPGFGQIPTSLALSEDEKSLYVACGGANAVAVVTLPDRAAKPTVAGYMPTGWFPIAIAARRDTLYVACSKGVGPRILSPRNNSYGVHNSIGTVQLLPKVTGPELDAQSKIVAANNRWGAEDAPRPNAAPLPVPERAGEPSVFKHVVYIIKENQTYDAVLGDMPEGNGNRALNLYGEAVTPNEHALAREFVLLDNTFTSGTNSADGHQWCDEAVANAYIEQNYNAHLRSYPYDGGDPLAYSPKGFLWTAAIKKGLSVRIYGEFVNRPGIQAQERGTPPTWSNLWKDYQEKTGKFTLEAKTDSAALRPYLHPRFIGFPITVSDQWRADQFLGDLDGFEPKGDLPALCMLLLPADHTSGTRPGMPTPRAAVADNDLAVGRIVDRISHSRFWKDTLILVIEDDSQAAVDHVDGHRTTAFCISAYTRRHAVISEPYNHTSLLRTMELVLGLPAMTRFDRTATPLTACFTPTPDLTPFTHRLNQIALDELNPAARTLRGEARRLALQCAAQDWTDLDRADPEVVARANWAAGKPGVPFPTARFHPDSVHAENDEPSD
ncbi:MAG TPA: bifunctional YncE family protein/alkaline phosphatase family protein [Chthonomonadaceae bacterium]|nr:bifunctional YncE family protein/alkaline phosphatase family protein [Chthonomonadaceae bacterium]